MSKPNRHDAATHRCGRCELTARAREGVTACVPNRGSASAQKHTPFRAATDIELRVVRQLATGDVLPCLVVVRLVFTAFGIRAQQAIVLWVVGLHMADCRGRKALLSGLHQRVARRSLRPGKRVVDLDGQPPTDVFTTEEVLRTVRAVACTAPNQSVLVDLGPAPPRRTDPYAEKGAPDRRDERAITLSERRSKDGQLTPSKHASIAKRTQTSETET